MVKCKYITLTFVFVPSIRYHSICAMYLSIFNISCKSTDSHVSNYYKIFVKLIMVHNFVLLSTILAQFYWFLTIGICWTLVVLAAAIISSMLRKLDRIIAHAIHCNTLTKNKIFSIFRCSLFTSLLYEYGSRSCALCSFVVMLGMLTQVVSRPGLNLLRYEIWDPFMWWLRIF